MFVSTLPKQNKKYFIEKKKCTSFDYIFIFIESQYSLITSHFKPKKESLKIITY